MENFVCFAAHPDDLEFSCTGTVYKFIQKGFNAIFVIATNGENGFKETETPRIERIEIRKQEQLRVSKRLGVKKVIFLDYKDGFIEYTEKLRKDLVAIIKEYQPKFIFSFDPANHEYNHLNLYHRDHRVVAEAVFDACFAAKNRFMYPGEPHRVEKLYFFGTEKPNFIEDITDLMDFKLELLSYHESQFADFAKVAEYIKNVISGRSEAFKYSEVFRVLEVQQVM